MNLWLNLRRSLCKNSIPKAVVRNRSMTISSVPVTGSNKEEIFTYPYGTKECVVYKQKGKNRNWQLVHERIGEENERRMRHQIPCSKK